MDIFSNTSVEPLVKGLDALSARQRVIANNVANASTPGYRTQDIAFKDVLTKVFDGARNEDEQDVSIRAAQFKALEELEYRARQYAVPGNPAYDDVMSEIQQLKKEVYDASVDSEDLSPFDVYPDPVAGGKEVNDVELDMEMTKTAETSVMYNTFVQAIVKRIDGIRIAIADKV
jgi:flagellar basal-body rod protein FlgB